MVATEAARSSPTRTASEGQQFGYVQVHVLIGWRTRELPDTLSRLGIAGGAVYDALVALAAKEHGAALATRDARAHGT